MKKSTFAKLASESALPGEPGPAENARSVKTRGGPPAAPTAAEAFSGSNRRRNRGAHWSGWSLILVLAGMLTASPRLTAGTWTALAHSAPEPINTMLLLSDGTVMGAGANTETGWYRLTPDSTGSYVNGTWSTLAPMNFTRLYYSSDVLTNGCVLIAGAEYGTGTTNSEVYDPVSNTWSIVLLPPGLITTNNVPSSGENSAGFMDSVSEILPNGNVLVAPVEPVNYGGTVIYNAALNAWSAGPTLYRGFYEDEASWVKLPDDSILTIDPFSTNSERFIPSLNQWVNDANVPASLYDPYGDELGAGFLLPDGRAFYLGSTGNTAFYTPSGTTNMGSWQAGPVIPNSQGTPDAPAAMMVNGKILCAVSPTPTSGNHFPSPTSYYEFDPVANAFTQVSGPTGSTYPSSTYIMRMLDLPDGTVLMSATASQLYVYQPGTAPLAAGKPVVNAVTANLDGSYQLTGQQLNGISEGAAYGDDAQMGSNYPLVRMTNTVNGVVFYARTYNWNSTSVMTGNRTVTVQFAVPAAMPVGNYELVAVANGIASDPVPFTTTAAPLSLFLPSSAAKNAGTLTNAGAIILASTLPTNLVVALTSSVPSRLTVTASVTILAGQTTTNFDLAPVDNLVHDGNQTVTVTAVAPGFTNVSTAIVIVDDNLPPAYTSQAASQTVTIGGTATFSVVATGKAPLNYFWLRNNNLIAGGTNAVYFTNNVQLADSGAQFSCLVSNTFGATNSAVAVLTVLPPTLVQNGGFETGTLTNWTQTGNVGSLSYSSVSQNSAFVHSGSYGLQTGPSGSLSYFSQTVPTTSGQVYLLSFWLDNPNTGTPNQVIVNWNGGALFNQSSLGAFAWTNLLYLVTATGGSTVIQFGFRNDPNYFGLDDVSLTPVPPAVLQSLGRTGSGVQFSWSALAGLAYQVQYKTNLLQANWLNLGTAITATGSSLTTTDAPASDFQRYYRLLVLP
jgi:hypothetical protein